MYICLPFSKNICKILWTLINYILLFCFPRIPSLLGVFILLAMNNVFMIRSVFRVSISYESMSKALRG